MAKKKNNSIISDVTKYNSWSEFCRLSHGNASLYDRIVYLYGLRMDQIDNHDDSEDEKEDIVKKNHVNSKKCHLIEYEQNYLTEVINLYPQLSIVQLQELLRSMKNLSLLRNKLRKECNANSNNEDDEDESHVSWESESERTDNNSVEKDFNRRMIEISREIQKKKWKELVDRFRPFLYGAAAVLLMALVYWGAVMYSGYQFSSQLAQFDKELLEIREKTGESEWKKKHDPDKWNKQSDKASELCNKVAKVDVPFLARKNFSVKLFNRSEGESFFVWNSYERLKESTEQRIRLYQTFSKSVDECGKALEKALNDNSIVPMESTCWDGLVYSEQNSPFTFEKNTSEKVANDDLIKRKNDFVKKWSENINSSFAKSLNENQSKFNVAYERNEIKQMIDIYNTIAGLPSALKAKKYLNDENKKNHEILAIENAKRVYDLQLKEKRKSAEAVLDEIDNKRITKDAGLARIKALVQDVNTLSPYGVVPEEYAVDEKTKTIQYINEIMNHADDYKYIVMIKTVEDGIKELSIPDSSNITITPDNVDDAMKQLESNKNLIDSQIDKIKAWNKTLPRPGELSSDFGKKNLTECIKVCDDAINLRDSELQKIDSKLINGFVNIAKDELEKIEKDFQKLDISTIGISNYIDKVEEVLKALASWQKKWRINSDKISDSSKRNSLGAIINSSESKQTNFEKLFLQNMKQALTDIAKNARADAIVKNFTNREQLNDLETKINSGIRELDVIKKKSMPQKQAINVLINAIESKFNDRSLEIIDQRKFNTIVDDLGLSTKSRADMEDFKKRLTTAQNRLDSSFTDPDWKMVNWENTHLSREVDNLREQIKEYRQYVNQLEKLRICCGTFYNGIYESPQSFGPYKTQMRNIANDIRSGAYRAIQGDIIDFSRIDLKQDDVQFEKQRENDSTEESRYKLIGFLDKNSGANIVHRCTVRYYCKKLPSGEIAVCTNRGLTRIGSIKVDPQTDKRMQYFQKGADSYVGLPVYMKVQY